MISKRMEKLVENNSAIRAMFEEGKRLSDIHGVENVYDFSIGNPYFAPPESIRESLIDIVTNEDPMYIHGYTPNVGYVEVRKNIADMLNKRYGCEFTVDNIIMSVGAAGGLNSAFQAITNPGEEIIVLAPYFFEYNQYAENFGCKIVVVQTDAAAGFIPDIAAIEAAITPLTKAIVVNSPNNPTGAVYSPRVIKALGEMLDRKQKELGTNIYIVADEPYRDLVYDGVQVPFLPNYYKNTIICYSWSKSLSLPGNRIGFVAISPEADDSELVYSAMAISTRILGFVNAPSLIQLAVGRSVYETTDISLYDKNRKMLYNMLTELGYDCFYPAGAFYLWVKTPVEEKEFLQAAKKYNLLLVPGSSFLCPGYVRIAYCTSPDKIERSRKAFEALSEELGLKK